MFFILGGFEYFCGEEREDGSKDESGEESDDVGCPPDGSEVDSGIGNDESVLRRNDGEYDVESEPEDGEGEDGFSFDAGVIESEDSGFEEGDGAKCAHNSGDATGCTEAVVLLIDGVDSGDSDGREVEEEEGEG